MEALNERLVRELLAEQFPRAKANRIEFIAEGEGRAFLVDDAYIFRFPRDEHGAAKMRRELCLVSEIAASLPMAVPDLEFVGQPGARYPYAFTGHRKITGRSGEKVRPQRRHWPAIARQLGEFFSALHALPVETGERCGLPFEAMQEPTSLLNSTQKYADIIWREMPGIVDEQVRGYLNGEVPLPLPSPAGVFVCHGDIKGEHIMMSERGDRIAGIIDWTDCCLSDRLLDFAGIVIWLGETFVRRVLEHYAQTIDEGFLPRVCFYARCFALGHLGQRLVGKSDAPVELLKAQARWAFSTE